MRTNVRTQDEGEQNEGNGNELLHEILPKAGLVYSEKGNLSEVLCKPKVRF